MVAQRLDPKLSSSFCSYATVELLDIATFLRPFCTSRNIPRLLLTGEPGAVALNNWSLLSKQTLHDQPLSI